MKTTNRSEAQIERQRNRHRNAGRYGKINPCELCGKSAGADYMSDERCNSVWEGHGVTLCEKCAREAERHERQ